MIKIRLAREGVKKKPFFRIVAIEKSRKRNGKPLDIIGYWKPAPDDIRGKNPKEGDKKIDKKKLTEWIAKGAQLSSSVEKLLEK